MDAHNRYAVCIENRGYAAALELRKIYRLLPDDAASTRSLVRVEDESGEDYLYPEHYFVPIEVPSEAAESFAKRSA